MRYLLVVLTVVMLFGAAPVDSHAQEDRKPEAISERMVTKFARGITNLTTCVVEIPKQSYLTVRDRGAVGNLIGPLKGIVMTVYRGLIGGVETIFFMVPQPGYYDPMIDPEYVWKGWEEYRPSAERSFDPEQTSATHRKE